MKAAGRPVPVAEALLLSPGSVQNRSVQNRSVQNRSVQMLSVQMLSVQMLSVQMLFGRRLDLAGGEGERHGWAGAALSSFCNTASGTGKGVPCRMPSGIIS